MSLNLTTAKQLAMTTAGVLAFIWLLNQTPAKPLVQKALG